MSKLNDAIARLENALSNYDQLKKNHAELTTDLTEAKKHVDACARGVVQIRNGADHPSLFDDETTGDEGAARDTDDEGAPDENAGTLLSGATGGPVDGQSYPKVEDGMNDGFCICGYAMTGPEGPNHDRRHSQFLTAVESPVAASETRKPIDMTKQVADRQQKKAKPARGARAARA